MRIALKTILAGPLGVAGVGDDPSFLSDADKASLVELGLAVSLDAPAEEAESEEPAPEQKKRRGK